jgi:hypothetical protein
LHFYFSKQNRWTEKWSLVFKIVEVRHGLIKTKTWVSCLLLEYPLMSAFLLRKKNQKMHSKLSDMYIALNKYLWNELMNNWMFITSNGKSKFRGWRQDFFTWSILNKAEKQKPIYFEILLQANYSMHNAYESLLNFQNIVPIFCFTNKWAFCFSQVTCQKKSLDLHVNYFGYKL